MASYISETTALLSQNNDHEGLQTSLGRNCYSEAYTESGSKATNADCKITRSSEAMLLVKCSAPLMITSVWQWSFNMTAVIVAGHLGVSELAAVSLATMTANITGLAVYEGLATSLDTLCSQAYGSGNKMMVGLHMQRMVYFLWLVTIPIGTVWISSPWILGAIVPQKDLAVLAGSYLRIYLVGAPGYATFEAGKRFVQAQGMFTPPLVILLFSAPLNLLLNWTFVWVSAVFSLSMSSQARSSDPEAEVQLGSPRRCCGRINDKYTAAHPSSSLCTLRYPFFLTVLAWLLPPCAEAVEPYDQACSIGSTHGGGGMAGL
jgi:MatE